MGKHGEPKGSQLLSSEPLHAVYRCELAIKGLLTGTSEDQLHLQLHIKTVRLRFLTKRSRAKNFLVF